MMRNLSIMFFLLASVALFAEGQGDGAASGNNEEWLKEAQLGEFRPAEDDWAAIEAAAKEEGSIVVYSNSSKIFEAAKGFYDEYGIKAIPHDIGTGDLVEKLTRLQDSGVYDVDVVLCSNVPILYNEFVDYNRLYKFIPTDVEPLIAERFRGEKLGIQRIGGKVVAYNTEVYSEPPIDSWWDLTRPEWKNRIIMKDPMLGGSDVNLMANFIKEADVMAKLYKEEFGEEIVLDPACENAGYEFIKRLLDNGIILKSGGSDVAIAVGAPGQKNPPLGIIGPSKLRLKEEQTLYFDICWGLKPFDTFMSKQSVSIAVNAPHPNAAKLFIKWLYGDEKGGRGFEPWYSLGVWPVRTDVEPPKGSKRLDEVNIWAEDAQWLYMNVMSFRDFWIQHM